MVGRSAASSKLAMIAAKSSWTVEMVLTVWYLVWPAERMFAESNGCDRRRCRPAMVKSSMLAICWRMMQLGASPGVDAG